MAEPIAYSVGMWTTKSGQSDAFVKAWKGMVDYVAQNSVGGIDFYLVQDTEQPNMYLSFGRWENADMFKMWMESPVFKDYKAQLDALCYDIKIKTVKGILNIKGNIAKTS